VWFADTKYFPGYVSSDHKIRTVLRKRLAQASVSRIQIERPARKAHITVHTARPGIVIGKKGEDIEKLRGDVAAMLKLPIGDVRINIAEIRKPELDAQLVAEGIAQQLERRVMFRRAMKRAVTNTMRLGAQGVKIQVGGRLNGAEIARSEWYREGRVPLHTLRADIDYGTSVAQTTYGVIGVQVWVYKGDNLGRNDAPSLDSTPRPEEERRPRGPRRDGRGDNRGERRGGAARRGATTNAAPADGSDKPQA
jgi:small subunit ribosomal protein S3